jgi:predicted Fe-Mo cluster-binding NifX family protein
LERYSMKIAFPTTDDKGMASSVYGHFGSAPRFIIVDSESRAVESASNPDSEHAHGRCRPTVALGGRTVDAVVVGGIGGGALTRLNAAGIRVYRAVEGTVAENLDLIGKELLPLFTPDQTCAGHGAGETCHRG